MEAKVAGFVPGVLDTSVYDEIVQVENDDAFALAREVARLEGVPVGIFIARGKPLRVGEHLRSECGKVIKVIGALEAVTTATIQRKKP